MKVLNTIPLSGKTKYTDCYHCGKRNSLHINANKKLGVILNFECGNCGKIYQCSWSTRAIGLGPVPLYNMDSILKSTLYKFK